jgi:signal transduction histidine kinase
LIAYYYNTSNIYDSALIHLNEAIKYYKKAGLSDNLSKVYNNLSTSQYYLGDYELAKESSLKALRYPVSNKIKAIIYTGLAMAYQELNQSDSALIFYNKALNIYRNLNDSTGMAYQYLNIGTIYLQQKELAKEAKPYFEKAYKILKQTGDKAGLSGAINNLAGVYEINKDYIKQLKLFYEAYAIDSSLNNKIEMAGDLNNIGLAYIELKDTANALRYLTKAFSLAKSVNSKLLISYSAYNLGELMYKNKHYQKARYYTLISLNSSKLSKNNSDILSAYYLLSKIESKTGNYKEAFSYLSKYTSLYDSVFTREKAKLLAEAKEKYETRAKQNRILALEQKSLKQKFIKNILLVSILVITLVLIFVIISLFIVKKSRNQIKQQQHYYSKLLSNSIEYTFVVDSNKQLSYVSPSYIKMFNGKKGDNLNDSFYRNLSTEEDVKTCEELFSIITKGKRNVKFEFKIRNITSEEKFLTGVAQNFLDDEVIKGIIVNLWDVTHLKETELIIQKRENELETSNKTKEKLFSIISHDLIGLIGTNSELMKLLNDEFDELDNKTIKKIIGSVTDSLDSTNTLVTNLLSWARIQMNTMNTERETILLFPVIEKSIRLYKEQLQNKSIELHFHCDHTTKVMADSNQLQIIFRNLIRNSIKFTHIGGNIQIVCKDKNGVVEICIKDNGVGMDKEQIDHILSNSGNIKSTIGTNNERGTGLGMIVIKEFVQLNKGKIQIKSEPDKGTEICIMLLK